MSTVEHPLASLLESPSAPPATDALPAQARGIFTEHGAGLDDFYAGDDIGTEWRERIARRAKLPEWERVLAFIDLTPDGAAKEFLMFGRAGLYYRNGADRNGTRFQPWERVVRHRAGVEEGMNEDQIRIGEALYLLAGSTIDHDALADMVDDLGGWAPLYELSPEEAAYLAALAAPTGDPAWLIEVAGRHSGLNGLVLGHELSEDQHYNSRERCGISDDEEVVAMIDFSAGQDAKEALVFVDSGVHHHNSADPLTPHFWSWPEVEASTIRVSTDVGPQLFIRGHAHTVDAEPADLTAIAELVTAMAKHMCPDGTAPHELSHMSDTPPAPDAGPDGDESVPTVTSADNDVAFTESVFFFAHGFAGLEISPQISDETLDRLQAMDPPNEGESLVAVVTYDNASTNLVLTTTGVRYASAGPDTAPAFLSWADFRAAIEDDVDDEDDDTDEDDDVVVSVGDATYSFADSAAVNVEMLALMLFLAYRAPGA